MFCHLLRNHILLHTVDSDDCSFPSFNFYISKSALTGSGPTYPSFQLLPLVKRPQREAPNAMIKNAWNYINPLQCKHGVVLNQSTGALFLHVPFRLLLCHRDPNHYHNYSLSPFFYSPSHPHLLYSELR
jgi:hypothetical protein